MMRLAKGGSVHAKYRRMIVVYADITAPLYWWKEFDTYKVGTVANSCSTMHKIHEKEFTLEDFSCEHICIRQSMDILKETIDVLNVFRDIYLNGGILRHENGNMKCFGKKDKDIWWQMIQLLPSSYNQRRTVMLNYEVLAGIYTWRKDHKLDEWREFCRWIEQLPYSEIITAKPEEKVTVDKSDIAGTLQTAVKMLHLHGYNMLGDEIAKIEKLFNESEGESREFHLL